MFASYRKLRQRQEAGEMDGGFTLIELLIVIVVLGILAAVVVFSLGSVTKNAAQASCAADVATVTTAAAAYNANNAAFPTTFGQLLTGTGGPYLQSQPTSTHYVLSMSGTAASFQLTVTPTGGTGVAYGGGSTNSIAIACAGVS